MKVLKYDSQILSNFGNLRWIFLDKIAYSLLCNVWKVDTRPTSASDFFSKSEKRFLQKYLTEIKIQVLIY
jgi:hypothetical protein